MNFNSFRILIVFLLCLSIRFSFAQHTPLSSQSPDSNGLFKRGVFLQNKNVLIPWGLYFKDIVTYGNPKILQVTNRRAYAEWDSVTILDGKHVKIFCPYTRGILRKGIAIFKDAPINTFIIAIDSADFDDFRVRLTNYAGVLGKNISSRREKKYVWYIDECFVRLRVYKDKFYYLDVQKQTRR